MLSCFKSFLVKYKPEILGLLYFWFALGLACFGGITGNLWVCAIGVAMFGLPLFKWLVWDVFIAVINDM